VYLAANKQLKENQTSGTKVKIPKEDLCPGDVTVDAMDANSETEIRDTIRNEFFVQQNVEDRKMVQAEQRRASADKVKSREANAAMQAEASKWFAPANTVRVESREAAIQRREIIKSMSRRTSKNSVLKRWEAPKDPPTTNEVLSGKELDSHRKYQERRRSRTEKFESDGNFRGEAPRVPEKHQECDATHPDIDRTKLDVKGIMSQWKVNQISNREPVYKRPNRIEDRINEEIRIAAEKEAQFRKEKGLKTDLRAKKEAPNERYRKEIENASIKLKKIEQIEAEIEKIAMENGVGEMSLAGQTESSRPAEEIVQDATVPEPEIVPVEPVALNDSFDEHENQSDIEKFEDLANQVELKQSDMISNSGSHTFSVDSGIDPAEEVACLSHALAETSTIEEEDDTFLNPVAETEKALETVSEAMTPVSSLESVSHLPTNVVGDLSPLKSPDQKTQNWLNTIAPRGWRSKSRKGPSARFK